MPTPVSLAEKWRRILPWALLEGGFLLLASFVWFGWQIFRKPNGWPDFLAYDTAARLVTEGHGRQLYDLHSQAQIQSFLTGIPLQQLNIPLYFINPPHVALLLAPLGYLSYTQAEIVWSGLMGLLLLGSCLWLPRLCGLRGRTALIASLAAFAFFPNLVTVTRGQIDGLVLLACVAALAAWQGRRPFWSGLSIGLALVKPQLLFGVVAYWLATRSFRALSALSLAASLCVAAPLLFFGPQVIVDFLHLSLTDALTSHVSLGQGYQDPAIYSLHGLATLLGLPQIVAWLIDGLLLVIFMALTWGNRLDARLAFAASIPLTILVSPHQGVQDLVLLIVPGVVLAAHLLKRQGWFGWWLLAACYFSLQACILLGGLTVLPMLALSAYLLYAARRSAWRNRHQLANPKEVNTTPTITGTTVTLSV
jgi:hypothetical protein